MTIETNVKGSTSGNGVEVDAGNHMKVALETNATTSAAYIGGARSFSENDQGTLTAVIDLRSTEVDTDYRARVAVDTFLDDESFSYVAQNTGKHSLNATTMNGTFTAGQYTSNGGGITTITTGVVLATYASFPTSAVQTLSVDVEMGFSAQPQTNTFIEWGVGVPGAQTVAPTDGVFFRLTSAGLQGIVSFNGTETSTGVFPLSGGTGTWVYTNAKRYQFIVYQTGIEAQFWVNDGTGVVKLGSIRLPIAQGRLTMAMAGQFFHKHRITGGAAGGVIQATMTGYNVRLGGPQAADQLGAIGNRAYGSYQGLSGGTMGGLATYPNSTNPTAAAPSNTALTANLPAGLGGQGSVTAAAAAATDGIWGEYAVPAGTVNIPGRRLRISGVNISAVNLGAIVAITATTVQFSLAFGHTAVSLATAEAATAKAPRRVSLGHMTWAVGAGIGAEPQSGPIWIDLDMSPIFVNPGERIALVGKFLVGTATASQVINFTWQPIYGWE